MKEHGGKKRSVFQDTVGAHNHFEMSKICFGEKIPPAWRTERGRCVGLVRVSRCFHAERKTKQQSVRARASLQHGPLIMQEVTDNSLLWAAVYYSSLFDLVDEPRVVCSYKITLTGRVFYALIRQQLDLDADAWTCAALDIYARLL